MFQARPVESFQRASRFLCSVKPQILCNTLEYYQNSTHVFFIYDVGYNGSGKTTLISKLGGKDGDEISRGHGLEYSYLNIHDEERDGAISGDFSCSHLTECWVKIQLTITVLFSQRSHTTKYVDIGRGFLSQELTPVCCYAEKCRRHISTAGSGHVETVEYPRVSAFMDRSASRAYALFEVAPEGFE